ncbi:hypothetical protein NHX12_027961 [Muraenolepis orangiensis]|uniref:F-BAR domain-containing protein n=1 Tax=Muraenolepis orangiensis TaxID=630683 RepID=A0A9Q0EGN6_9TELE|nr:hypothetical protein NHX12_027961 [Muraenolepis orangiensis]
MFKLQIEHVGQTHLQLAQTMRDEAKKLEDQRERQKDSRRKLHYQMDTLHKQKVTQFKRTLELQSKAQQAKQNADEADRVYLQNVTTLAKVRDDWLKEHINTCEVFETQTKERINTLRNTVWTHVNQLSRQCVNSDELYEEVRKSLEQSDIKEDIEYFINLRRTGANPPAPVLYENFYNDVIYSTLEEPGYSVVHF